MTTGAPLFPDLSEANRRLLETSSVVRAFGKNELVIHQGDTSDSLFLVLSGRVKVFVSDESGREVVVNTLGEGQYFGELAGLSDGHRIASIRTTEPCEFRVI